MKRTVLFLICLMLGLVLPHKSDAKVYLVAVGIGDYPGTANDLRYPSDDVRHVVSTYKAKSLGMIYVQLYDSKATTSNILSSLQQVFSRASRDDIVVLFVSGHGYEGGFVAYDGFLEWSRIRKAIAKCRSRHKMIFADTCFSGTFRSNGKTNGSHCKNTKSNVMLFLSSRSNEKSIESGSMKHGVFTAFLCSGLSGKADANHNKVVTARELFNYVYKGVAQKTAGKQHPVMWGSFSNNMPVIRLK